MGVAVVYIVAPNNVYTKLWHIQGGEIMKTKDSNRSAPD